jgi:fatty acid desaturase
MDEDAASPKHSVPASRRWRTGEVGFPTLVVLLLVLGAAGLAAASIGGWGSVTVLVILMVAFLGLVTSWAVSG